MNRAKRKEKLHERQLGEKKALQIAEKKVYKTEIPGNNNFRKRLAIALKKPNSVHTKPETLGNINRLDTKDVKFAIKLKKLTNNFSKPLEDAMLMYSEKKGVKRFTVDEYERYQTLASRLSDKLTTNGGDYSKAYSNLLQELDKNSLEYRIIEKYYNKLQEQER